MAQLRIRKKLTERPRTAAEWAPFALVLAAGLTATFLAGNGTRRPADLAAEVKPLAVEAIAKLRGALGADPRDGERGGPR